MYPLFRSKAGTSTTSKDWILKDFEGRIFILFQFDLIKISVLHFPSRLKWPQDHLLSKQVKLSPNILWVDKFSMGSTITHYMRSIWEDIYHPLFYELMIRWWNENVSLNFGRGNSDLSQSQFGRGYWDLTQTWFIMGGMAPDKAASHLDGSWEGSLISWIKKDKRPRNNDKKNLIAELRHERGLYTQTSCLWHPPQKFTIGWACWIYFG